MYRLPDLKLGHRTGPLLPHSVGYSESGPAQTQRLLKGVNTRKHGQ